MLPSKNRLKKKKQFKKVFTDGKSFKNEFLVLKINKNGLDYNRFGFIVSKKVSKKAVKRNQVKRRLREIVKKEMTKIKQGFDVILISLAGIEEKNFQEMQKSFLNLIHKSKIL